jgi:regulator of RNase E activity RraA
MTDIERFLALSPTTVADTLPHHQIVDYRIRPLWTGMRRIAGPAFPVRCAPGDNLMLHGAIYRADPGTIICVEAGDLKNAVAGGNVCAIAQRRGVAGFIVDGVIRDLVEVRELGFPVFARGVVPKPGVKEVVDAFDTPVNVGGVRIWPGDTVIADDDGVVVIPKVDQDVILEQAERLALRDAETSLDTWELEHRAKTKKLFVERGIENPF